MGTVLWAGAVVDGGGARLFEYIDGYIRGSRSPVPSGAVFFWCGVAAVVLGGGIYWAGSSFRGVFGFGGGGRGWGRALAYDSMKFSYLKLFVNS